MKKRTLNKGYSTAGESPAHGSAAEPRGIYPLFRLRSRAIKIAVLTSPLASRNKFWLTLFLTPLLFLLAPHDLSAATLTLSPASGSYHIGQTVVVSVLVSSADKVMNAASGVVSFPRELLEATSVSKSGSIISLWAEEPKFSNANGTVNFEGVILNPGFNGRAGRIITVYFKVKAIGNAELLFSSASVLANDGQGTNILDSSGSAKYILDTAPAVVSPQPITAPIKQSIPTTTTSTALSIATSSPPVVVIESPFEAFTNEATRLLSLIVPLIALLILLLLLFYYGWLKYMRLRKQVDKESQEAEISLEKAFRLLRESVAGQIKILESAKSHRKLSDDEVAFLKQLKTDLNQAEAYVKKEIKDIEKLA